MTNETKQNKTKRRKVFSKRTLTYTQEEVWAALAAAYPEDFPFDGEDLTNVEGGKVVTLQLEKESR